MRGLKHMEQAIDSKFKGLVSSDSFRQYLGLSYSAQQRLRQQFEDIFMSGVEMVSYPTHNDPERAQAAHVQATPSTSQGG